MTYEFTFSHHQWVRHRLLPDIAGYVADMSIDECNVEWVKILFVKETKLESEWLHAAECELFTPSVNGFGKGE